MALVRSTWIPLIGLYFLGQVFLLLLGAPSVSAKQPVTDFQAPWTVQIEKHPYRVAVASTPQEQERGLMFQKSLPERTGMLFPIQPSRPVAFWMKNTLIPLDMLFIQNNRVVEIVHNVQPCKADPCSIYRSKAPVDAVIELPGGTAHKDRLKLGASVQVMWQPSAKVPDSRHVH